MVNVRPLQPSDIDTLYAISLATGSAGADATHLYEDGLLLGHIYSAPYACLEPGLALIVEDDDGVAGFAVGATDTARWEAHGGLPRTQLFENVHGTFRNVSRASHADEANHERPQLIELLLDGERPEMPGKPGSVGHKVCAIEPRTYKYIPGNDVPEEDRHDEKISTRGRQDTIAPSPVKGPQGDAPGSGSLLNKQRSDEITGYDEEDSNTELGVVSEKANK